MVAILIGTLRLSEFIYVADLLYRLYDSFSQSTWQHESNTVHNFITIILWLHRGYGDLYCTGEMYSTKCFCNTKVHVARLGESFSSKYFHVYSIASTSGQSSSSYMYVYVVLLF